MKPHTIEAFGKLLRACGVAGARATERTLTLEREAQQAFVSAIDAELQELQHALAESLKLQSHYAFLLNISDGGRRMQFPTVDSWLKRLRDLKQQGVR